MKRFRLGTLLLLVVIAAQSIALVVQHQRATRREAEIVAEYRRLARAAPEIAQHVLSQQSRALAEAAAKDGEGR